MRPEAIEQIDLEGVGLFCLHSSPGRFYTKNLFLWEKRDA